jgi:hypothetical protein
MLRSLIAVMMEATSTSETSVNFYQTTRRNNPEDSHLHNRRRENLQSLQLHILEILILNLGLETCWLEQGFSWLSSVPPGESWASPLN